MSIEERQQGITHNELVYETWRSRTPEQCIELSTAMFYDTVLYAGRKITTNPATKNKKLIFRVYLLTFICIYRIYYIYLHRKNIKL